MAARINNPVGQTFLSAIERVDEATDETQIGTDKAGCFFPISVLRDIRGSIIAVEKQVGVPNETLDTSVEAIIVTVERSR